MSELLEPDDDTLIWSAWVFLRELSLTVRNLHTQSKFSCILFHEKSGTYLYGTYPAIF